MAPKTGRKKSRTKRGPAGNTVKALLSTVGIEDPAAEFAGCDNLEDEFNVIKRAWHRSILAAHPDKGGDREVFQAIQAAFEVLKDLKMNEEVVSFVVAAEVRICTRHSFSQTLFLCLFVSSSPPSR